MSRLPTPGGDLDVWAAILNDYLAVSLDATGRLRSPLYIGAADTSIYRSGAGIIRTDGQLQAVGSLQGLGDVYARAGHATAQSMLGASGANAILYLGSLWDTYLQRESAGVLKTGGVIKATAFTVAAAAKPGEEPDEADEINLLTLIERLSDRVAELEAKLTT